MAIDRSVRIMVDSAVSDDAWLKLIRKILVAGAELGTTVTTTDTGYTAGTGADNVEIDITLT